MLQDDVAAADLGAVNGVQASLCAFFEMASFVAGLTLRTPQDFAALMAASCAAVALSAAVLARFAMLQRCADAPRASKALGSTDIPAVKGWRARRRRKGSCSRWRRSARRCCARDRPAERTPPYKTHWTLRLCRARALRRTVSLQNGVQHTRFVCVASRRHKQRHRRSLKLLRQRHVRRQHAGWHGCHVCAHCGAHLRLERVHRKVHVRRNRTRVSEKHRTRWTDRLFVECGRRTRRCGRQLRAARLRGRVRRRCNSPSVHVNCIRKSWFASILPNTAAQSSATSAAAAR